MSNTDPRETIQTIRQTQLSEPMKTPIEEIRLKAKKFEKRIRNRNLREYIGAAIVIAFFPASIVIFPHPLLRASCVLVIAGSLYVAYWLHSHGSAPTLPEDFPSASCIAHFRTGPVRQRDLPRSVMT